MRHYQAISRMGTLIGYWYSIRQKWYRRFEESFDPYWPLHLGNVGLKLIAIEKTAEIIHSRTHSKEILNV